MISLLRTNIDGYDLCIIGAGPAGLTLAAELAHTGLRIAVLESGIEHKSEFADELRTVTSDQLPIRENSRERTLGGLSSVWGGISALLDEVDTETWPITAEELASYLDKTSAYRFPDISEFRTSQRSFAEKPLHNLATKKFIAVRPPYRFSVLTNVFNQDGVDLYLDASVVSLIYENTTPKKVTEAVCMTKDMNKISIKSKAFVLAAGGIENARLLLVSGLGNEHDQVGRYFMNHPKGYSGTIMLRDALPEDHPLLERTINSRTTYEGLRLTPEYQRSHKLLNSCVQLQADRLLIQKAFIKTWKRLKVLGPVPSAFLKVSRLKLRWFIDMEPRSENRVTLGTEHDAFGAPRAKVSYALGERDKATLVALHGVLRENVEQLNGGTVEGTAEEVIQAVTQDASHHIGATRMGVDPNDSVVDPSCRAHSVENLFVAGSSVFRTASCANPTLTIVALTIRLARHLESVLSAPRKNLPNGA